MRLSIQTLSDLNSINSFETVDQVELTEGEGGTIAFMLIDQAKGRRYCPSDGATLQVIVDNIDSAKRLTRTATQPYDGDLSIWTFSILPTDPIRGTVTLLIFLTETDPVTKVTRATIQGALRVTSQVIV